MPNDSPLVKPLGSLPLSGALREGAGKPESGCKRRTPPTLSVGVRLQAEPHRVCQHVLELLDEMSAPMHPREIERALCRAGFTRSQARPIVNALKHLPIIAIGAGQP